MVQRWQASRILDFRIFLYPGKSFIVGFLLSDSVNSFGQSVQLQIHGLHNDVSLYIISVGSPVKPALRPVCFDLYYLLKYVQVIKFLS